MFGDVAANEWLMMLVRWIHTIGAVTWIGGSMFFVFIIRPLEHMHPELIRPVLRATGSTYRELVDIAVIAIIVSGLILMFNRLTGNDATPMWFIVLGVKLVIALWMFYLVWHFRQPDFNTAKISNRVIRRLSWLIGYNAIIFLGVVIFLLTSLMKTLLETSIRI